MVDILHRLGISAPASSVYESFTTIDGLSRWWTNTLTGDPRPGGRIDFRFGGPDRRIVVDVPGIGVVESWEEVTDVAGDLVTFRSLTRFRRDDVVLESTSTLRFRERPDIEASLRREGFRTVEVRDAPDRPGRELVFLALRPP